MHLIEFTRFRVTGRVTKNRVGCWHIPYARVKPPATWTSPRWARSDCCQPNRREDRLGVSGLESILFTLRSLWTGPGG